MPRARAKPAPRIDPATQAREAGWAAVRAHGLFGPLFGHVRPYDIVTTSGSRLGSLPRGGLLAADAYGTLLYDGHARAEVGDWIWATSHVLAHLGFGHADPAHGDGRGSYAAEWRAACCVVVDRFLDGLRLPATPPVPAGFDGDEERLARRFTAAGIPTVLATAGAAGGAPDLWEHLFDHPAGFAPPPAPSWRRTFALGLAAAVEDAVDAAGQTTQAAGRTAWTRAVDWFASSYPLLGALAAGLRIVEDAEVCRAGDITIAAVCASSGELYLNPQATLNDAERRFVVGHELLHAGLRHDTRCGPRHHDLYNVAADYVINGWLVGMQVGSMPSGCLHDSSLAGMSVEEVYDQLAQDMRRFRKLAAARGVCVGDVLGQPVPRPGEQVAGVDLDAFYRRALTQGLDLHHRVHRGFVPAGLEEEIRALEHPPPPWDVCLAAWFDERFPAVDSRRTYARPSRRQSSTPDIPRPSRHIPEDHLTTRTFGVVLDTSGSMDNRLLGHALGAIASYATARDVHTVRVVFCDAAAYDAGWLSPEQIAARVTVRGRGGTILQPGVDLLTSDPSFPKDGPILLITDGHCDHVRIPRHHAWLISGRLPFTPQGPVFRLT